MWEASALLFAEWVSVDLAPANTILFLGPAFSSALLKSIPNVNDCLFSGGLSLLCPWT